MPLGLLGIGGLVGGLIIGLGAMGGLGGAPA